MASPHNVKRYGEVWKQDRIDAYLVELEDIKDLVVISGGWAWHFMSPKGHIELKHAHDHKDVDIFVRPTNVVELIVLLENKGFSKVRTRFDAMDSKEEFRRYEKTNEENIKLTIDFFVDDVIFIEVDGWKVVEPSHLLSLYSTIHSSKSCFAVSAASELLAKGESILYREELVAIPKEANMKHKQKP